jgi:hypothetical protein
MLGEVGKKDVIRKVVVGVELKEEEMENMRFR